GEHLVHERDPLAGTGRRPRRGAARAGRGRRGRPAPRRRRRPPLAARARRARRGARRRGSARTADAAARLHARLLGRPGDDSDAAARCTGALPMNRLADETSPYLLQHADNPVDWHPWGDEAFARAREEDKPVLLSIGYAACHWCHVMAHESFEDADVALLMNERFVSVKVDREERPD